MASSVQEKQHVGKEVALRYLRAREKKKGIMLREVCATTGYSPPYAADLLRTYAKRVILGGRDPGPYRALSLAQTAKACVRSCRGRRTHLDVSPCWRALWQATAGSHAGAPACPGEIRDQTSGSSLCCSSPNGVCHHGRPPEGGEDQGRKPETCSQNKTRKPVETHPHCLVPGTLGCCSGLCGGGPRESSAGDGAKRKRGLLRGVPRNRAASRLPVHHPSEHSPLVPGRSRGGNRLRILQHE